ncbi:MAG: glycosyltransferase family 2 protein [Gemmataceae bacterium]
MRWLTAIPVYNEAKSVSAVLSEARRHATDLLVVDDGSTDDTPRLLNQEQNLAKIVHPKNLGYGAALRSAFSYAIAHQYDYLVTMDCDGQHQPDRIGCLLEHAADFEIVSGSRYLREFRQDVPAPNDRRYINATITAELNSQFGLSITDSFCGFKAYRVSALSSLRLTEDGWGMPLELWVQAAKLQWRIQEIGVPRVYLDPSRAFGGVLNDPTSRLAHYRSVITRANATFTAPPASSSNSSTSPNTIDFCEAI